VAVEHPAIGLAADFYRLRITRMDDAGDFDFAWRDDILYKRAPGDPDTGGVTYRVEAVGLDDPDATWLLYGTAEREDALSFVAEAEEDLHELTRSNFEKKYFPPV
jgi:hypothetical protein